MRWEGARKRKVVRKNLARLFPYFGMLSTEDFRVEKAITFAWSCLCISLATDLYSLNLRKVDVFGDERIVERV
jgi:hypothetical protein